MSTAAANRHPLARLGAAWSRLDARERRLVLLAATVVIAALLWWLALAPALATLRQAAGERAAADAQMQQMQRLKAEAESLKALPRIGANEALKALEASVKNRLGNAGRLAVAGNRATVTLTNAGAADLAAWLQDARVNARAVPTDARLTRSGPPDAPQWSGTLSLALPES